MRGPGFQKPMRGPTAKVSLAVMRDEGYVITCNCGWSVKHQRTKVRETKAQRHVDKAHGGRSIWL